MQRSYIAAAAIAVTTLVCAYPGAAHDYTLGSLQIAHPWARATPAGATVGAGYMTITNTGTQTDRLVGGSAAGASRIEVHASVIEGGLARMRPVKALEIGPNQTVELKPGGLHIMLIGLKRPLTQGE